MYPVGEISRKAERLIEVTYESLEAGIAAAKPGNTTGDIGAAIQKHAEAERTSVVRDFVGHGVGQLFHDEPNIMHFGVPGTGVPLKPGMIFTIEPMINLGRPHVKILSDGWTAVTRDRTLSAQCEHSIGITETGREIFTPSPARPVQPPRRPAAGLMRDKPRLSRRLARPCPTVWLRHAALSRPSRARARPRFLKVGAETSRTPNCSNCCCTSSSRAATPRRSPRHLLQALRLVLGRALGASSERLARDQGAGRHHASAISRSSQAAAQRFARDQIDAEQPILVVMDGADRLLPRARWRSRTSSSSASCFSTRRTG